MLPFHIFLPSLWSPIPRVWHQSDLGAYKKENICIVNSLPHSSSYFLLFLIFESEPLCVEEAGLELLDSSSPHGSLLSSWS